MRPFSRQFILPLSGGISQEWESFTAPFRIADKCLHTLLIELTTSPTIINRRQTLLMPPDTTFLREQDYPSSSWCGSDKNAPTSRTVRHHYVLYAGRPPRFTQESTKWHSTILAIQESALPCTTFLYTYHPMVELTLTRSLALLRNNITGAITSAPITPGLLALQRDDTSANPQMLVHLRA